MPVEDYVLHNGSSLGWLWWQGAPKSSSWGLPGCTTYSERIRGLSWHRLAWAGGNQMCRIQGIVVFRITYKLWESGMMGREGHSEAILQTKTSPHHCAQPINHHSFHQAGEMNSIHVLKRSASFLGEILLKRFSTAAALWPGFSWGPEASSMTDVLSPMHCPARVKVISLIWADQETTWERLFEVKG